LSQRDRPRIGDIIIIAYNQNATDVTISEIFGIVDQGNVSFKLYNRDRSSPWSGGDAVHSTALVATMSGAVQSSGFNDNTLGSGQVLALEITDIALCPDKLFVAVTGDV